MKKFRSISSVFFAAAVIACFAISATGQTEGGIANVSGGGSSVKWDITAANAGATLTISFPDGRSMRKTFRSGASAEITIGEKYFESPPDGVYAYELQLASAPSEAAIKARGKDDDPERERAGRKRPSAPSMTQSGSFAIVNGSIVVAGGVERQRSDAKASNGSAPRATASAKVLQRIRNNHRAFFMPDQVIPDDLIVQGSACVGLDCVDGESFSFDTIRMKENNTRLTFMDTSTTQGFSTNDWTIRANSSVSGGESFLGFVDKGLTSTGDETGTIVFQVNAGAPANSIKVSSTGRVGFRTATPVLDLHMNTSNTPAVRFEQNNSGGFTAQTWDIGANEANFFVRDVTSGSLLPFRIRPGAPTSSLDISANGNVGIATASPDVRLDVEVPNATTDFSNTLTYATAIGNVSNKKITIGYDETGHDIGLIQSVHIGTGFKNLAVNPNGGNVGIATTAPTDTLSVNGTASKPGGGSWAVFSDERLKNVKGHYTAGLNAVMRLQPLRYTYKSHNSLGLKSDEEYIGFGAKALQEVIPAAVMMNANGFLQVNNDPILWTMLNAIKEQQAEIAKLKREVRKLRATRTRRQ